MGYPNEPYSFSGVLRTGSKLVIILVMLLGRHRGLPESVDTAVNTSEFAPLERLIKREEDEYEDEVGDQTVNDNDIEKGGNINGAMMGGGINSAADDETFKSD